MEIRVTNGLASIWGRIKAKARERDYATSALGFLGAICIIGLFGHVIDWFTARRFVDLEWIAGFVALGGIIVVLAPNRLFVILTSLLAIIILGVQGALIHRTLIGLWLIAPCAIVLYFLVKWKEKEIK
jgi:hypothetical protein